MLENFRDLDEGNNQTHEPRVNVSSSQGEFSVRLSTGKLYLYDPHDMTQQPAELDIPGLIEVFTGSELEDFGTDETAIAPPSCRREVARNLGRKPTYSRPRAYWPGRIFALSAGSGVAASHPG